MEFGVPREVRDLEMRVGLTPAAVLALTQAGHTVYVQSDAGAGARFSDEDYRHAGAQIVYSAAEVYGRSDVVAKLSRPTAAEHQLFRPGQTIFAFFHLAVASSDLYLALADKSITAISYEMIVDEQGRRPVLLPASEVAGRLAPTIAGQLLRSGQNLPGQAGLGILIGGIPGVPAADVVILGGGVVGSNAARAFLGMDASVTVLDNNVEQLRRLDKQFQGRLTTMFANVYNLTRVVKFADVLVGAVVKHGQRAPVLISREMVKSMREGSVILDFSIDEGGCVATSRPTTLRDPAFVAEGVIHHCVPNITSTVARTASYAISNAALPYLLAMGTHGLLGAIKRQPGLSEGVNLYQGLLVNQNIADALGRSVDAAHPFGSEA